jgi:cytochrome c oxidase subunit 1
MPRRYADYLPSDGFTFLNTFSTIGSFVLGASTLPFLYNVWKSYRTGQIVTVDDPWGHGNSLEWATSCPPPLRNFDKMPRIRSERPAFDAKFPKQTAGDESVTGPPGGAARPLTGESSGGAAHEG